ncbi:hypothetical protein [Pedobacter punctiformis]|uniref:Short-chain dehydrogenase n=1 Tax=Pedobacter punctiformis TaxID=3004097 RepID=A0ABT4L631_9SPHI|nr:hypothetical protein [Pedobacter sp. HCMS5-2]MCZ4242613.1 hypothetical protein [Pedobacter sp. HCMS5-2]
MKQLVLLSLVLLLCGCSKTKTDQALLELDKKELAASINYDKILFYKFAKIAIRSSAVQDTTMPEYRKFVHESLNLHRTLSNIKPNSKESISVVDALLIYNDYRKVKNFVKNTDEDIFPLLIEGFNGNRDSVKTQKLLAAGDKLYYQNVEHAILSMAVLATRDLGREFALYECSKTQPELLKDSEEKTLLEFIRGFLFFSHKLLYLSEDGLSRNITWLEKNKNIPLPYTRALFGWGNLNNEQTNVGFHSMNVLFRGFDRLMMEREIDEERALQDFELFLKDTETLGLQNELIWCVESYLYLKREKPEKATVALNKLRKSPLLSNDEKEAIDKTIVYLKDRDSDSKLKGIYDKYFIGKIATKYMFAKLAQVDWEKVMKQQNVPHTAELFATVRKVRTLTDAVDQYTNEKAIEKGKTTIKETGSNLLDKAKGIFK